MNSIEKSILEVIRSFDSKANELISMLGMKFDIDLSKENPFDMLITRKNNLWKGSLSDNWIYQFHGSHCRFENKINNQVLDVKINKGIDYGIFTESTLLKFIETSKGLNSSYENIKESKVFNINLNSLERKKCIIEVEEFGLKSLKLNKNYAA